MGLDPSVAEQAVDYILLAAPCWVQFQHRDGCRGAVLRRSRRMQLVIHARWRRVNRAWDWRYGRVLPVHSISSCKLRPPRRNQHLTRRTGTVFHSWMFPLPRPKVVGVVLEQAALGSPIFNNRWRWDATRALALPRFRNGKKIPRNPAYASDDLLAGCSRSRCLPGEPGRRYSHPGPPLVHEVMKMCLGEALDLEA